MGELRTLVADGHYCEGPRWHDGRWWVSDFYRYAVYAIDPESGAEEKVLEVENQPSGLGWLPGGSLLAVSMRDHELLRRAPDGTDFLEDNRKAAREPVLLTTTVE